MKEKIVQNAWGLVSQFHSLKKLNFLPSAFGMIWLLMILVYQVTFALATSFNKTDDVWNFLKHLPNEPYFISLVIGVVLIFVFYSLLNPIAKGGMIHMMHTYRQNNGEKFHRSWQGFFDGLSHFLPIFEVQNITAIFAPLTIITFTIFLFRITDSGLHATIGIAMCVYFLLAFLLNMCFAYAPFFIVFEGKKAREALANSTAMAVGNINITARLYFTNLLLYLRVLFIGALFLLMPFIISSTLAYFTIISVKIIFLVIFSLISIILFVFIVYLNSVLEIFILAVWYEAYLACKEEMALHQE